MPGLDSSDTLRDSCKWMPYNNNTGTGWPTGTNSSLLSLVRMFLIVNVRWNPVGETLTGFYRQSLSDEYHYNNLQSLYRRTSRLARNPNPANAV